MQRSGKMGVVLKKSSGLCSTLCRTALNLVENHIIALLLLVAVRESLKWIART